MTILQSQIDDAPRQLRIALPPEWKHRRAEVIVRPLDEQQPPNAEQARPRYRHWLTTARVMLDRDTLHER
jgi:hypothetical protein